MTQQKRGQLTQRIKDKSKELLGYEMSVDELRLMPYAVHCLMDGINIDPQKCSEEDRKILSKWRTSGYIEGGAIDFCVTEEFWNILCEFIMLGYVDLSD